MFKFDGIATLVLKICYLKNPRTFWEAESVTIPSIPPKTHQYISAYDLESLIARFRAY